jgi:lysophospholipase L1-like esterase
MASTGGNRTNGGAAPTGGAMATGGSLATGGLKSTGGSISVQTGGAVSTGGSLSAGGALTTGGSLTAGGSKATGGAIATGGKANGGASATGGAKATGGSATGTTGGSVSVGGGGNTPITVWMSGDSTMAGDACVGGGWGDQFGTYFNNNVTIKNLSVAGRSIQTWLYEKNVSSTIGANGECTLTATTYSANWTTMLNGMKAGDWLLVEFGINDGTATCPRHVGSALFESYLTMMAQAATARGANTIFLTSTSAIECNGATATPDRGFGPETKAAGTADNVPVIDMTVLTATLYTSLGLCPNAGDYTSTTSKLGLFFCNDHTHFEVAGALQIAGVAAQAIKNQNIPLAVYLK